MYKSASGILTCTTSNMIVYRTFKYVAHPYNEYIVMRLQDHVHCCCIYTYGHVEDLLFILSLKCAVYILLT